jgi:hypothetical protein
MGGPQRFRYLLRAFFFAPLIGTIVPLLLEYSLAAWNREPQWARNDFLRAAPVVTLFVYGLTAAVGLPLYAILSALKRVRSRYFLFAFVLVGVLLGVLYSFATHGFLDLTVVGIATGFSFWRLISPIDQTA